MWLSRYIPEYDVKEYYSDYSDYSTESNIEAAKEAAKYYDLDLELYEYELREMQEEEIEELERQQMKLDGYVDDMRNPYNY